MRDVARFGASAPRTPEGLPAIRVHVAKAGSDEWLSGYTCRSDGPPGLLTDPTEGRAYAFGFDRCGRALVLASPDGFDVRDVQPQPLDIAHLGFDLVGVLRPGWVIELPFHDMIGRPGRLRVTVEQAGAPDSIVQAEPPAV